MNIHLDWYKDYGIEVQEIDHADDCLMQYASIIVWPQERVFHINFEEENKIRYIVEMVEKCHILTHVLQFDSDILKLLQYFTFSSSYGAILRLRYEDFFPVTDVPSDFNISNLADHSAKDIEELLRAYIADLAILNKKVVFIRRMPWAYATYEEFDKMVRLVRLYGRFGIKIIEE